MHAATCVATSPLRNNPRRRGLSSDSAPLSFIARLRSTREERRAGTRPKVIPVSRLDKSAKVRTRVSGPTSSTKGGTPGGRWDWINRITTADDQKAKNEPNAPPKIGRASCRERVHVG